MTGVLTFRMTLTSMRLWRDVLRQNYNENIRSYPSIFLIAYLFQAHHGCEAYPSYHQFIKGLRETDSNLNL